jgi:importin-7
VNSTYTVVVTDKDTGLQQEQPALYENLTKNLNPEEQQVVQGAVHQADVIAQAQAQAQQAAANGGVPAPQQ